MVKATSVPGVDAVEQTVVGAHRKSQQLSGNLGISQFLPGAVPLPQEETNPGEGVVDASTDNLPALCGGFQILGKFFLAFSHIVQQAGQIGGVLQADGSKCFRGKVSGAPAVLPDGLLLSGFQNMSKIHEIHRPETGLYISKISHFAIFIKLDSKDITTKLFTFLCIMCHTV